MPKFANFLLALFLFIILLPVIIISFLILVLTTKSNGFFTQTRIGQYGNSFTIYKLQTLIDGNATYIGRFLRKTKIDELPQLINILKGDMSFVGPRPDIPGYYDQLKGRDAQILILKPGLTSLAAIKYRNEEVLLAEQTNPLEYNNQIIFPDKVKMNLEYLKKRSFLYDIKIILLTIKTIFN